VSGHNFYKSLKNEPKENAGAKETLIKLSLFTEV
jgi:hypothetical protein